MFSFSNDGYITRINDFLLEHLEFGRNEVENTARLEQLLTVGSRIFFQTHFYPLIKLHGKANEIFLSFRTKSGKELPVLLNVLLAKDEDGFEVHCGGLQISQRNRFEKEILEAKRIAEEALLENHELLRLQQELETQRKRLERKLRTISRNNSEQRQISTIVSHDLQEPLRKISILTDLILTDKTLTADQTTQFLQRITTSIAKVKKIILSMQQFLRMENMELHLECAPLQDIIESAKQKLQLEEGSEVNLNTTFSEKVILNADRALIENLFYELFSNSLRFCKEGGNCPNITITSEELELNVYREIEHSYKYENFIRITYSDDGIGFDNKYGDAVFELFRSAHSTGSGIGVGLTYCKKIVDLHFGSISVKSEKGKGSTFTILLPA